MQLPLIKDLDLMQAKWKSILDPVLAKAFLSGQILSSIKIVSGSNVINHRLGRQMQGWILSDIDSNVQVFRSAPFNDLTLTLTSNGSAVLNLLVF